MSPECLRVAEKNTSFQSETPEGVTHLAPAGSYSSAHPQLFLSSSSPFFNPSRLRCTPSSPLPQPGQHHSFHFIRFSRSFIYFDFHFFPFYRPQPFLSSVPLQPLLSFSPCHRFLLLSSVSHQFAPLLCPHISSFSSIPSCPAFLPYSSFPRCSLSSSPFSPSLLQILPSSPPRFLFSLPPPPRLPQTQLDPRRVITAPSRPLGGNAG